MPPRLLAALVLLTLAPLVIACGRAGGGDDSRAARIALANRPERPAVGPETLEFTLTAPDGTPIGGATVEVEGVMTHAGMAPVIVPATEQAPGRYAAAGFAFTMAGDWRLIVRATLPDGRRAQQTFTVDGVREAGASRPAPARAGR